MITNGEIAIFAIVFLVGCLCALFAQYRDQVHQIRMKGDAGQFEAVLKRLAAVESRQPAQFDQAAFDDLKAKVESLRLSQGIRGSGR